MENCKRHILQLPVYKPGKPMEEVKRELGLNEVIKLASNENPYGCSAKAKEAIAGMLDETHLYPDGGSTELTAAIAAALHVKPEQIIFGAGSDDVIMMIARAYFLPGDETIMASHTFPQYKHNALVEGAVCIEVPLVDGKHDLNGMLAKVTDKTKIVWICNPNNPTGTMTTGKEIEDFMSRVPQNVLVVLDEAYAEYVDDPSFPDSLALMKRYPNIILLKTFSKIYGLASLRIGYGIGHPDVIRVVNQVREPFNTTRYAQKAALAAFADQEFVAECKQKNLREMKFLNAEFARLGLPTFPAYGNFIMVETFRSAELVFNALLRKGIIVRGGHHLDFPTKLRVTVGTHEQNVKFIRALEAALAEVAALAEAAAK
ncbi:MAG TPA: histidinol-phosphate transaminase [Bacilli bacterium]